MMRVRMMVRVVMERLEALMNLCLRSEGEGEGGGEVAGEEAQAGVGAQARARGGAGVKEKQSPLLPQKRPPSARTSL